eukprot:1700053-Pyramimonas_sp.AAC.1
MKRAPANFKSDIELYPARAQLPGMQPGCSHRARPAGPATTRFDTNREFRTMTDPTASTAPPNGPSTALAPVAAEFSSNTQLRPKRGSNK